MLIYRVATLQCRNKIADVSRIYATMPLRADYIYIDRCGLAIYKINRCAPRNGLSLDKPEGTEGLSTFRARGR